jgi:hypothetical protein
MPDDPGGDWAMTQYALYDFTTAQPGEMFYEWEKPIEVCLACGRSGFDDSDAMDNAFVHVMGREEELIEGSTDVWKPASMFFVHEYCNKVTTDYVYTEEIKKLPNHIRHPRIQI